MYTWPQIMSQTKLSSFAIAGLGAVGRALIKGLASSNNPPTTILVLSRDPSKLAALPPGVIVAKVNYEDVEQLASLFTKHGVDCVVSTLSTKAIHVQNYLADAAKKTEVKLFVPSQFGLPTDGEKTAGTFRQKDEFKDRLIAMGIPYMRCYNGVLTDHIPGMTGITQNNKVNIVGSGDVPISFTATEDVGGFVAYALTTLPFHHIRNATFRLEGHRLTLNQVARFLGYPVAHVSCVPSSDEEASRFYTSIQKRLDGGYGCSRFNTLQGREMGEQETTDRGENARALWKGHVWKRVGDIATSIRNTQ